jgi:hypothetical protein
MWSFFPLPSLGARYLLFFDHRRNFVPSWNRPIPCWEIQLGAEKMKLMIDGTNGDNTVHDETITVACWTISCNGDWNQSTLVYDVWASKVACLLYFYYQGTMQCFVDLSSHNGSPYMVSLISSKKRRNWRSNCWSENAAVRPVQVIKWVIVDPTFFAKLKKLEFNGSTSIWWTRSVDHAFLTKRYTTSAVLGDVF